MSERALLPPELSDADPGPTLAAALAAVDRSRLNGHDVVTLLTARARQVAHDQAELMADLAELAHCPPGGPEAPVRRVSEVGEFAADEVRAALKWTRAAARRQLDLALTLVERLPTVHAALAAGMIDLPRARVICDEVSAVDDDVAHRVVAQILPTAANLTTGQVGGRLRRLVLAVDPDAARRRYEQGLRDRRVVHRLLPDGTALLTGEQLPADRTAAVTARIDALARAARAAGDDRSLDQLRADTFLDLLEGAGTAGKAPAGGVELTVPLTTLMGLADRPGELAGWGPVVADVARQVAERQHRSPWRFSVLDHAGRVLQHGTTRRRPTAADAAHVKARDGTCTAPGCRVPAAHADLDHTRAWAHGGASTPDNLAVLCRHDHRLKHEGGWRVRRVSDGVFAWTSALGHTYLTWSDPRTP